MKELNIKYLFLMLIIFFSCFVIFINANKFNRCVLIEGMENKDLITNKADAFCESHRGSSSVLQKECDKLTYNNCNSTSCCVWNSKNKCVAGTEKGPTYNTDENGKTNRDYYYYKNKCYGKNCPNK